MPTLRVPNRARLVDDVRQSLEDGILTGQIKPSERLIEASIAEQLGCQQDDRARGAADARTPGPGCHQAARVARSSRGFRGKTRSTLGMRGRCWKGTPCGLAST